MNFAAYCKKLLVPAVVVIAVFLLSVLSGHIWAWNSGGEENPGPTQAQQVLLPWNGDQSSYRTQRNEHGYLLEKAFSEVIGDGNNVDRYVSVRLPVWVRYRPLDLEEPPSQISVLPVDPKFANYKKDRFANIAGMAGLADHSFSLWDWATGNESCPLYIDDNSRVPTLAQVIACHEFVGHLGAANANHFVPQAGDTYRWYHKLALEGADYCKNMRDALKAESLHSANSAYVDSFFDQCEIYVLALEAFGQHFLQDSLAVGHMWHRWGSSDLRVYATDSLSYDDRKTEGLLVGAISGIIHGTENMTTSPKLGITGTPDLMSSGIEKGYIEPNQSIPLDGLGDGYVHELLNDGQYLPQRIRLLECTERSLQEVWHQLGKGPRPQFEASEVDKCLGNRNTTSAVYRGLDVLGEWLDPSDFLFEGIPYLSMLSSVVPLIENVSLKTEAEFRWDILKFAARLKMDTAFGDGDEKLSYFGRDFEILGTKTNEFYRSKEIVNSYLDSGPPSVFNDPQTLVSGPTPQPPEPIQLTQGRSVTDHPVDDDPINTGRALKRLFNKAHLVPLCEDEEFNPNPLEQRVLDLLNGDPADYPYIGVACEICTEVAARHVRFPFESGQSMCQTLGETGWPITYSPSELPSQLSPLETAAAEWCGCSLPIRAEKVDSTDQPLNSEQGRIFRVDGGAESLDCGTTCQERVDLGSITSPPVMIQASAAGGWSFKQWADDSSICPGETTNPCPIGSFASEIDAKAVFEQPRCTSTLSFEVLWKVTCVNSQDQTIRREGLPVKDNDGTPDQMSFATLETETYLPGDPNYNQNAWYRVNVFYGDPEMPLIFETTPILSQKTLWETIADGTRHRTGLFNYSVFSSGEVSQSQLETREFIDRNNYTATGKNCTFLAEVFRSYVTVVVNGLVDNNQSTVEDISAGACPTPDTGQAINSITLEESIIYQCVQMGKTYNNCPLAPF